MYIASIKNYDVANGPGIRVNVFVSGCTHRCKNCFNENTWSFHYGEEYNSKHEEQILKAMEPSYIAGITFLGGEPMEPSNRSELLKLTRMIHQLYPSKSIWCYSGYLTEELLARAGIWSPDRVPSLEEVPRNRYLASYEPAPDAAELAEFLSYIDILVDGEFEDERRNLMLRFRGSENQRLVDLKRTIASGEIVLEQPK